MLTVLVIHREQTARDSLSAALSERGLAVLAAPDLESSLEVADGSAVEVALVEPELLEQEQLDIATRIEVRANHPVRVVALCHLADPARRNAFALHNAALLDRPAEDLDAMAAFLERVAPKAKRETKRISSVARIEVARLPESEDKLEAPVGPDGQGPFVLVVDDEEDCRELFAKILTGRGYRVHAVSSGTAALRFLSKKEQPVHLIVSDISMPQVDGFELKQMVDEQGGSKIPFIAVAGTHSPERVAIAKKLGVAALLPKPIQVREFCKVVRGALDRAAA